MSEPWRLLLTGPGESGFNMALDEALATAVRRGWSPPTLRIYQWAQPTISLGCHQPSSIVEQFAEAGDVAVVRRPTGGGAVFHCHDVSYALACSAAALRGQPSRRLYQQFHQALGEALAARTHHRYMVRPRGARARPETSRCFQQPVAHDLMSARAKVAGAAQRRWRDGLLQQGTLLVPALSVDRAALGIRTAWADVFHCRFVVGTLTVQERLLTDDLWSTYRPWMRSSSPPVTHGASNPSP